MKTQDNLDEEIEEKREKILLDFTDAMFKFIQKYPPEGFNLPYFTILVMSGRLEEATNYLDNKYTPSEPVTHHILAEGMAPQCHKFYKRYPATPILLT